jgi:hypothetical protein
MEIPTVLALALCHVHAASVSRSLLKVFACASAIRDFL